MTWVPSESDADCEPEIWLNDKPLGKYPVLDPVGSRTEPTAGISVVMISSVLSPSTVVGGEGAVPVSTWVC